MDELILHCKTMLKLMDEEHPNKYGWGWAVEKLCKTVSVILEKAENNIVETKDIDYFSLVRCYVDEGGDYNGPILSEFGAVKKILKGLQSKQ